MPTYDQFGNELDEFGRPKKRGGELRDMKINRVSLVGRPSNRRSWLLLKQAAGEEETPMDAPTDARVAFEKAVDEHFASLITKRGDKSVEAIRAQAVLDMAREHPELYQTYRETFR